MEKLKHNITKIYGNRGKYWLDRLPQSIKQLQNLWNLSALKPITNLSYNYILEGFQGKTPIIVKLSPDADLVEKEAKALNAFKGFGAISVLGCKEGALLLERAIPGDLLKNRLPKGSRIEIACKVIERLHQAPVPTNEGFPFIEELLAALDKDWNLPKEDLRRARKLKKELLKKSSGTKVLLHGDLHQENILSNGNNWVIIDPKGVIGEPIHELWACVEDPPNDLAFLANYFGYPFEEVAAWYYVQLILAACWQAEDGLDPQPFLSLAQSIVPMLT